ncbi:MAG: hypothetical protein J1F39_04295 [Clostridiales bacterium]|nr:hypothetical protein [Clostridiales bacterium]
MRSKKNIHSRARTRFVSIVSVLAIAFTALSFGFFNVGSFGTTVPSADGPADELGVKFVQIAAGEDFVIGLTYDGELYGWSTKDPNTQRGETLGSYYQAYPTKINVKFVTGHSGTGNYRYGWANNDYHASTTNSATGKSTRGESILQIATTRTTAAFVTNYGYVYTWGYDPVDVVHDAPNPIGHMLLLRDCSTADAQKSNNNNEPYMINYGYYSDGNGGGTLNIIPNSTQGLEQIVPTYSSTTSGSDMANISIAGGEYNYTIMFTRTSVNNPYSSVGGSPAFVYTWGSMMYDNTVTTTQAAYRRYDGSGRQYYLNDGVERNIYALPYSSTNGGKVYAGGYTTAVNIAGTSATRTNHTTSLMLRGRNFLTSVDPVKVAGGDDKSFTVTNTVKTPSPGESYYYIDSSTSVAKGANDIRFSDNTYTFSQALIGARFVGLSGYYTVSKSEGQGASYNNDLAYGRQVVASSGGSDSGEKFDYTVDSDAFERYVYDSQGNKLNENSGLIVVPDAISIGNDIGYGISGNKLYSWGDNAYGQNGGGETDGVNNRDVPTLALNSAVSNSNIFDVAAGKQVSGRNRAFYDNNTFNGEEVFTFKETVKNDENYISGVLRATNPTDKKESELWVWSNKKQDPTRILYGGVSSASDVNFYNQFIKIFSGYGNKLFALTRLGQVVMIEYKDSDGAEGNYVQTIYDSYSKTPNGAAVTNWTVATEDNHAAANYVSFTAGQSEFEGSDLPELGVYTITVNDAGVKSGTDAQYIVLNDGGNNYKGDRQSLVTGNNIGNVYRIMNPDTDNSVSDGAITVPTTSNGLASTTTGIPLSGGLNVGGLTITSFAPKFYWVAGGTTNYEESKIPLTEETVGISSSSDGYTKVGNMFEYKFGNVSSNPNVTGLSIKPLQSTKGGKVKVEFYIGRYATAGTESISGQPSNTQLFFDYKLCTFDFDVLDTPAYKNFEAFGASGSTANIPLLDPNNPYNNTFSVAVQDVSGGIHKLIEQFFSGSSNLENAIYDKIAEADRSFPASSRKTDGKLEYYLNETDLAKYNNRYQFLFSDRDADRITIRAINKDSSGNAVTSARDSVSVSVELDSIQDQESATRLMEQIKYKFNNVYGLYDIKIEAAGNKFNLSFKFDIVRYTATGSTGTLSYSVDNNVTGYLTTNDATHNGFYTFSYDINEYYTYNENFTVDTGRDYEQYNPVGDSIVSVFSQPSLIATYEGATYYGKNDGNNTFTVSYANLAPTMVIGNTSNPLEIPLSRFVATTGSYIMFSYADANNKYSEFNRQFPDETGTIDSTVTLSRNMITVTPMATHSLIFTVAIQRFHSDDPSENTFTDGTSGDNDTTNTFSGGNEKIYIRFEFPGFKDFDFAWNNRVTPPTLTSSGLFDLLGEDASAVNAGTQFLTIQSGADYRNRVFISQLQSSDTSVLRVQTSSTPRQSTKFNFETVGSGTSIVTFVVTLYGKSMMCSLQLSVSAITYITDTIELVDVSTIYVNTLLTELRRANSTYPNIDNFTIIYSDPENAVFFTDAAGERVTKPNWIGNISFLDTDPSLSNPRLRVEINESENDMDGVYNMHIRYVNGTAGYTSYEQAETDGEPILETSQPIISSRRVVPGDDGEAILTVRIDTDNVDDLRSTTGTEKTRWYVVGEGDDLEIRIPSAYLLSKIGVSNVEDFEIFLVTGPVEASEYFNYGYSTARDYVSIRPQRNTPLDEFGVSQAITINVSVSSTLGTTDTRYIMSLRVSVTGISETLSKERYTTIWLVAFFSSFALLLIIFLIRMIVYWRARAKQRQIIKRNQELIKLRDRMHNKSSAATREQVVKSKLKMQDPKYAKLVNEMRQERQGAVTGGVVVENGAMSGMGFGMTEPAPGMPGAAPAGKGKGKKDKKAKPGKKKSIAELKAELEAKKMAFAQAQQNPQAAPPPFAPVDAQPMDAQPMDAQPVDAQPFGAPGGFDAGFGAPGGFDAGFGAPGDPFGTQDIDASGIIFDAPDNGQM